VNQTEGPVSVPTWFTSDRHGTMAFRFGTKSFRFLPLLSGLALHYKAMDSQMMGPMRGWSLDTERFFGSQVTKCTQCHFSALFRTKLHR
jgi:hypothetical protein